jgi:3D (Asp-Asp-Asp) domain-containing protein
MRPFLAAQLAVLGAALVLTVAALAAAGRPAAADVHLSIGQTAIVDGPSPGATRFRATVTAYSSSPDETWGDGFITASGRRVFEGLVACPRQFAFGTQFRIAGRIYACFDRLHRKYDHRFDIWMTSKELARAFGKRRLVVEVVQDLEAALGRFEAAAF